MGRRMKLWLCTFVVAFMLFALGCSQGYEYEIYGKVVSIKTWPNGENILTFEGGDSESFYSNELFNEIAIGNTYIIKYQKRFPGGKGIR